MKNKPLVMPPRNLGALCTLLFLSAMSFSILASEKHQHDSLIGWHGMVVINDPQSGLYASHLPLYSKPHDYQIVYRIELEENELIQSLHAEDMVTLMPEKFDLQTLVDGESMTIDAAVYQGHFERGGKKVATVPVAFVSPILVKQVNPSFTHNKQVYYLVSLGERRAMYIHKIQTKPSFDAIGIMTVPDNKNVENQITCNKAQKLNHQSIIAGIQSCSLPAPSYLETRDFR